MTDKQAAADVPVALVVAADEADGIGRDGRLPWHLPGDLAFFKRVTMGCPLVMGRKTHESIGRALPGRRNIVVTRDRDYRPCTGAETAGSLEDALELARSGGPEAVPEAVMVIGGAEIFAAALPQARRLYLTRVHATVACDTFLPAIDWSQWRETWRETHPADARNPYAYSFLLLERA
jgi:dihydrofolate reductase